MRLPDVNLRFLCFFILVAVVVGGCRRATQFEAPNRRLIESLRTAVLAKNEQWLIDNERVVESRKQEGQLKDAEYEALVDVIRDAKAGDWAAASKKIDSLAQGQKWSR